MEQEMIDFKTIKLIVVFKTNNDGKLPNFDGFEPLSISPSHFKVLVDRKIEIKTNILMSFFSPDLNPKEREALGQIVRVEKIEELEGENISKKYSLYLKFEKEIFTQEELKGLSKNENANL